MITLAQIRTRWDWLLKSELRPTSNEIQYVLPESVTPNVSQDKASS